MLFQPYAGAPATDLVATTEMVRCLLSYTYGLEDCFIDVELVEGAIMLTGTASSKDAAHAAISVAADFTSKPVISGLQVAPTPNLDSPIGREMRHNEQGNCDEDDSKRQTRENHRAHRADEVAP